VILDFRSIPAESDADLTSAIARAVA